MTHHIFTFDSNVADVTNDIAELDCVRMSSASYITSILSNNRCNIYFLFIITHITPVKSFNRCNI